MSVTQAIQPPAITRVDATATEVESITDDKQILNSQGSGALATSTQGHGFGPQSLDASHIIADDIDITSTSSQDRTQIPNSQLEGSVEMAEEETGVAAPTRPYTPSIEMENRNQHDAHTISSSSSSGSRSPSHGSKRTASGLVKASSPATNNGLGIGKAGGGTPGLRISELSLQLKTNLKYAMIKVQNGWEQRSIDEVENLAATHLSCHISTTSTMVRRTMQSPRSAMAVNMNNRSTHQDYLHTNHRPTDQIQPRTASSSWPHPLSISPELYDRHPIRPSVPTLAPAPELHSKSRPNRIERKQSGPATSNVRATTPTPQEQDAVDTLLFMSSPANSQRFANGQNSMSATQQSPSGAQLAMPRRQLGLEHEPPRLVDGKSASSDEDVFSSIKHGLSDSNAERQAKRRSFGKLKSDEDVEKLLDEICDYRSSEEEGNESVVKANGLGVGM